MRAALWMLVGLLAGGLMALAASDAHAIGFVAKNPGSTGTVWGWSTPNSPGQCQGLPSESALAACVGPIAVVSAAPGWSYSGPGSSAPFDPCNDASTFCQYKITRNSDGAQDVKYFQYFTTTGTIPGSCPSLSTEDANGNCVCNLGYKPVAGGGGQSDCQAYTCPKIDLGDWQTAPSSTKPVIGSADVMACEGWGFSNSPTYGCMHQSALYAVKKTLSGQYIGVYVEATNGSACQGGSAPDATGDMPSSVKPTTPTTVTPEMPDAPNSCGAGLCPGTVNGASVCVACSNTETKGPSVAASGAGTGDPAAPAGTTSTTSITTCNNYSCTTTTNYYSSSGALIGTKSETKPTSTSNGTGTGSGTGGGFCAENPTSPICKTSSFGGQCGGTFTCDGDAIQCAIAKDQLKRNCTVFDDTTAVASVGQAAYAAGVSGGASHPKSSPTVVDMSGGFDQTNLLSGSCPSSISIPATGSFPGLSMNLGPLCTASSWLGNLLVGLTALACVAIVFVKGG